jgi:hypothetical protein
VAILPDETPPPTRPVAVGRFEQGFEQELAMADDGDAEFAPLDAPSSAGDDAFEFEFDSAPLSSRENALRVDDGGDLAQATVLDPKGASGYDVSSSDLRDVLTEPPRKAAPAPRPPAARRREPAPASFEPVVSPEDSFSAHSEMADEAEFAPLAADELDESSLEVLEPREAPAARRAPARPAPSSPRSEQTADADALMQALTPQLRAQLHDTLEKIAWESFSSVTEQIVRQALERVEAVAWEVIPQMAETLVREEIRRMKGGKD